MVVKQQAERAAAVNGAKGRFGTPRARTAYPKE
jgi:hypothetical protein